MITNMQKGRRLGRIALGVALALVSLAMVALAPLPAAGEHSPPPETHDAAGSGQLGGTELVEEQAGIPCFRTTRTLFGLRGTGTFEGRTSAGGPVVYRAQINPGQTLYGNGPLQVQLENTEVYYHSPFGTHGTEAGGGAGCSPTTAGTPVPAEFRIFAAEGTQDSDRDTDVDLLTGQAWVYRMDEVGNKIPCVGRGTFSRGGEAGASAWTAEWTLSADCVVVGNEGATSGTGGAPRGTVMTHHGSHGPCFDIPCADNLKVDYAQYLPKPGPMLRLTGPASVAVGCDPPVTITARLTVTGWPEAEVPVTFSVAGPGPALPPGGTADTDQNGQTGFTFSAAIPGDYTVTATATVGGEEVSGTHTVRFTEPPPLSVALAGPDNWQTEEPLGVTATVNNACGPLPGAQVDFTVTWPPQDRPWTGQPTPSSGSAPTGADGRATFSFSGDRAGDYLVTASTRLASEQASATHTVHLDIRNFKRVGGITLPDTEKDLDTAVMDPAGRYAYFGGAGPVIKVDLATFERVASTGRLLGPDGREAFSLRSSVIDPAGRYAYFGDTGGQIYKIDLQSFAHVGTLALAANGQLESAVIDPAGRYAYFGTLAAAGNKIVKVDLATFTRVGTIDVRFGDQQLGQPHAAVMDPAGRFAYFGTNDGWVLKVDLATFQAADALPMPIGEDFLISAVIDPAGHFAYFGAMGSPGRVVKIDLRSFKRVDAITLAAREAVGAVILSPGEELPINVGAAAIDPAGEFAYFGAEQPQGAVDNAVRLPAKVLKIDLRTFERIHTITLDQASDERSLDSVVVDPVGGYAYFGTNLPSTLSTDLIAPDRVVKVQLKRQPNPALSADADAYGTDYATPLTVAAPGVLDGDSDPDNDPLVAVQASDPAGGNVVLDPDGSFTYAPDAGFAGTDTFTYTATDGMDYSAPATVSVTVAPPQGLTGGAFGYHASDISLFGGPQPDTGPAPAVTLAPDGSNSPQTATAATGRVAYGPAHLFTSGPIDVSSSGSLAGGGSVSSSTSINDVNTSRVEIFGEDNYDCCDAKGEAYPTPTPRPLTDLTSTCSASASGVSGSTTISNGWLYLDSGWTDGDAVYPEAAADAGGLAEHDPVKVPLPTNPEPDTTYTGHIHLAADSTDDYRVVFNEQTRNPDGSLTVNAVHQYLGTNPPDVLTGDLVLGQTVCGAPGGGGVDRPAVVDFDGDARSDIGVYRPGSGVWYLRNSTGGDTASAFGTDGDVATPADYDGDGTTDIAVYRPATGVWYLRQSSGGDTATAFGTAGDVPVPGDYDGDAKADVAVYRPSTGVWYLRQSSAGDTAVAFGTDGDVPTVGDYDGDAKADVAVYRPSTGVWYLRQSSAGDSAVAFGTDGDVPVVGDYDGDAKADVAVYRPSTGVWYLRQSSAGDTATAFGSEGDVPAPADYDGDAKTDVGVFRPSTGVWYLRQSTAGDTATVFGTDGDVALPLPAAVHQRFFATTP